MAGSFSKSNVVDFLEGRGGGGGLIPLPKDVPTFKKVPKWDGKDLPKPKEEEDL